MIHLLFGAVHGAIGDEVLNIYLNDVVTVPEYGTGTVD